MEKRWSVPCRYQGLGKVWFKLKMVKEFKILHIREFRGIAERSELLLCQKALESDHVNSTLM